MTASGRFAALTNFRDSSSRKVNRTSRGQLVSGYLTGIQSAETYLGEVAERADQYDGFNLVVGNRVAGNGLELYYLSSRNGAGKPLAAGVYGISNHFLDTPWPKLLWAKASFQRAIAVGEPSLKDFFQLLADDSVAPDDQLPDTGVGIEWERRLSPTFIVSPGYGTRASTVLLFHRDGEIRFRERSFGENGKLVGEVDQTIASCADPRAV